MDALNSFENYLYTQEAMPPLIRLGLIHYQFEAIHPFLDGNGRVGRLLITLLLCAWKILPQPFLYLSAYFEENRQHYYELLFAVSQKGDWEAWLEFFMLGISTQARDAVQRVRQLQHLREVYRERWQSSRMAARLLQVIDLLFVRPVFTIKQVAEALELDFVTVQRYVDQLIQADVLREITGRSRNRIYAADAVLKIIEAPHSIQEETFNSYA